MPRANGRSRSRCSGVPLSGHPGFHAVSLAGEKE